jgi:hypothetical protein
MCKNQNFKIISLKIVGKSGGKWGEMITFATDILKVKKYACVF